MKIIMLTEEVLKLLYAHAKNHKLVFVKQMDGWKKDMEDYSRLMVLWAHNELGNTGRPEEPPKPVKYTKEYDRLIDMMEHHADEYIELDEEDYKNVIKDEFGWKAHFMANSTRYRVDK